jgi:hypothetical protein
MTHDAHPRPGLSTVAALLLTADAVLTAVACIFLFPVGVALLLGNAIAAAVVHGRLRWYLAGIATAGSILCLVMAILLVGTGSTTQIGPVSPL